MSIIKYWTRVVSSHVDQIVRQIENHESMIDCALKDMREASLKATSRLSRIKKDGQALRLKITELEEASVLWESRAREAKAQNRAVALQCLERSFAAKREKESLEKQAVEQVKLEKELVVDLQTIQERLEQMQRKKHAFSARQARTEALRIVSNEQSIGISEIQGIFERWERKLEDFDVWQSPIDELEDEFSQKEKEQKLEAALENL